MARGLPAIALTAALLASAVPAAGGEAPRGILVAYSFEEADLATGPDTFTVFENSRGRVDLSTELPLSGWASIRIEDAPGDGDFPELQGYFERRSRGSLFVHFALLVAEPDEELNIALAGPAWFALGPDGIAFWLRTENGELVHVSDSIPKRLLRIRPFVWYAVDVALDLDRGTYDLSIREEGLTDPVVDLHGVPNAASAPGSAVDKFSFIGDLPGRDLSRAVYFVDDVLVGVDEAVRRVPFAAPGRRNLFFDRCWRAAKASGGGRGPCPAPAAERPGDVAGREFEALLRHGDARSALELAIAELAVEASDPDVPVVWRERAAAAAYYLGLPAEAETWLEEARALDPHRPSVLVALSDLAHLRGDLAAERELRESVFGSLSIDPP